MHKLEKKVYYVIFILTALVVVIGLSYAYYLAQITGSETSGTVTSNTATLALAFSDGSGTISGSDIAPGWSDTKTFSIQNTGNVTNYYDIRVTDIINTFAIDGSIVLTITSSDGGANITERSIPVNTQSIAFGVSIAASATHNYTIKIEYKNLAVDQSVDLGASFSFKLGIISSINPTKSILLSRRILGDSNSNVGVSVTTPGIEISKSGEAVLASTTDDYGTTYYYRGAINNNYIIYANMCWRIVRITGNGAIKLVLYNYNPSSADNPCDVSQDSTSRAFARYSGTTYTSAFNTSSNSNAHVGFMYGTPGSASYAAEHANTNKSAILNNLETWYESKLSAYESFLADTIWCNDKSLDVVYPGSGNLGYDTSISHYSARGRIYANNTFEINASPSLICPIDSMGGKLSHFTVDNTTSGNGHLTYKTGLLTVDETSFAGGRYYKESGSSNNSTFYLNKNANGTWWWTMSPGYFISTDARVYNVDALGRLSGYAVNNIGAIRPAVSLIPTTKVTGSGTSSNPYVLIS